MAAAAASAAVKPHVPMYVFDPAYAKISYAFKKKKARSHAPLVVMQPGDAEALITLAVTEEDLAAIDQKIKGIVDESVKFAEESPYPGPEEAFRDVYMQKDYPFIME